MSNFDKLTAMGADIVGGDLLLKHKVLGHFRNGDLVLTEEGVKMLAVDDVVAKEDTPKVSKARKAKAEQAPVVEDSLDHLLGDIEVQ